MSAANGRVEQRRVTHEEVAWLRSFGWGKEQIALRLGITVGAVESHINGRRGAA